MLKTQEASLKTLTCASCLAASVPRHTTSNTSEGNLSFTNIFFYFPRLPPAILSHNVSCKIHSFCNAPLKSNSNTKSVCKWLFLISVCSCENSVRSCVLVYMLVLYWLPLVCGGIRMDQWKEGRTEHNTQTKKMAKRMTETQNEPHINLRQEERFI